MRRELGNIEGYSERNLWNMRLFYNEYKEDTILQQLVAELPWGHNLLLMSKIKDKEERKYYIKNSIDFGWSRDVLNLQIKANVYSRHKIIEK